MMCVWLLCATFGCTQIKRISVETRFARAAIGKNGETVEKLQDRYRTHIDLKHNEGIFTVIGTEQAVTRCTSEIERLVFLRRQRDDQEHGRVS